MWEGGGGTASLRVDTPNKTANPQICATTKITATKKDLTLPGPVFANGHEHRLKVMMSPFGGLVSCSLHQVVLSSNLSIELDNGNGLDQRGDGYMGTPPMKQLKGPSPTPLPLEVSGERGDSRGMRDMVQDQLLLLTKGS